MTTNDEYEAEWRKRTDAELADLDKNRRETAVILERTSNNLTALEQRMNRHEQDHNAAPVNARGQWQVMLMAGGCLASLMATLVAILGTIVIPLVILYVTHH